MIKYPINVQYTSYFWLIDKDGNPVTGATASITATVMDEGDVLFSNPTVSEVDSSDAPGLYKASFTPDAIGFWKIQCDSTLADADIAGGEVIYVEDVGIDENGDYAYPDSDATEKELSEGFTTPWSTYYAVRRTHQGTMLDFNDIANDATAPDVTIRRYVQVDGANWRRIEETTILNADLVNDPCVYIEPLTLKRPYKITVQLSAGLTAGQDLPYHYVIKREDRCA